MERRNRMSKENKMQRKRGRPPKDGSRDMRLEVRIGPDEREAIEHMLIESDKNKSELIRKAVMMYYHANYGRW